MRLKLLPVWILLTVQLTAQNFVRQYDTPFQQNYNHSSSVSWGDIDGDGDLDVYITNGEYYQSNEFYLNDGKGGFLQIRNSITEIKANAFGSCFGDYDNDGDLDLFVAAADYQNSEGERNHLFNNNGNGAFTPVSDGPIIEDIDPSYACSWVDYDNDGWLDLFVANAYEVSNRLYRNLGDGTFERITEGSIVTDNRHNVACTWVDFDNDRDSDLLTITPGSLPQLYRNNGNGTFQQLDVLDLGFDHLVYARSASWADFDSDGWMDVILVDGEGEDRLYRNVDGSSFEEIQSPKFEAASTFSGNGSAWGDYDNDADLDLILMHHLETPGEFHQNDGTGVFTTVETSINSENTYISYALSAIDYDQDGRLDYFQTNRFWEEYENYGAPNTLWRNISDDCGSYTSIQLEGMASNSKGVGAKVWVYSKGTEGQIVQQVREMRCLSGGGYTAQSGYRLHFGLGEASTIDSVRVDWPSGANTLYTDLTVNEVLTLSEEGSYNSNPQPYELRLEAQRDPECPGRINKIDVFTSRGAVKWYKEDLNDGPVAFGSEFFVPETNGTTTYIAVDECGRSASLTISEAYYESQLFPNPTADILYLNLATYEYAPKTTVRLYNSAGQYMWTETYLMEPGYNLLEFDLSRYASGTYFVEIVSACYNSVEKIVVVR